MRPIRIALLALTLLGPQITDASTGTVAQAEAQTLLETLTRHFSGIRTLTYTAERTTRGRRQSNRERWVFAYQAPGLMRVDYQYPVERHLILTPDTLTEYLPALRKALRTHLGAMTETNRAVTLKQTLSRISLDGINPANFQEMTRRTTSVIPVPGAPDVFRISGLTPKFLIELDRHQKVIRTTDIYTPDNSLLLHTEASRFIEAGPGFWYPQHLEARYWTDQGFVDTATTLGDITINGTLPPSTFQFTPPDHVTVEDR